MKELKFNGRLTTEERETILIYNDADRKWVAETSVPKHFRKFLKQGWKQTSITTNLNGDFIAAEFEACDKTISIGKAERPNRPVREITPEQIQKMQEARKSKINSKTM